MAKKSVGIGKGIIAVIIIVGAGFLLLNMKFQWVDLGFFGGTDNPALPRDLNVLAIDSETGELYHAVKKKDEDYPLENPDTGSRTLWAAYVCHDEKVLFAVKPKTMVMSCPVCRSGNVGGAAKEHEDFDIRPLNP